MPYYIHKRTGGLHEKQPLLSTGLVWIILWAVFICPPMRVVAASPASPGVPKALPEIDHLPERQAFPDPLRMLDGRRVTSPEQWYRERRPELLLLFQHYMYGFLPALPRQVAGKVEREEGQALDGIATLQEITITCGSPAEVTIHLLLVLPRSPRPAPVVLAMNYFGNHTLLRDPAIRLSTNWMPERGQGVVNNQSTEASRGTWTDIWRIRDIVQRGYALATFYNGDVDPDREQGRGLQSRLPPGEPGSDCGTIAAWAWGLQRAVDYLVESPRIDKKRIIVTGHSRLGKAALLAAAFDERIAMAIPHQAGSGGSAPNRTSVARAETVRQINDKFPHWFNTRFKQFNDRVERLPFDQHCLVALCAPRPVLFTNGRQDTWINPEGQFQVLRAAAPVYQLLGAGDFTAAEIPPDGEITGDALGFFLRPGGHSLTPADWKAFLDFADRRLGRPEKDRAALRNGAGPELEVKCWDLHEFEWRGAFSGSNPYREVSLVGEFVSPSGKIRKVDGFCDGDSIWRLRFCPDEVGEWHYRVSAEGTQIRETGRLRCTAPRRDQHGFIRVHPSNPHAFAYADGTPFFPMGDTCYGLFDDTPITPELRTRYLETRRRQGFNFVRMSVGHSAERAAKDPAFWAWGGTAAAPDLDRLNPVFFRAFDAVVRELASHEMNIELLLLNLYRRPFTDPLLWTVDREQFWLRYLLARYGAFSHIFLWTLANEYELHADGRYRLDRKDDVEWVVSRAQQIKSWDAHRHLLTVHPVVSASSRGSSPRDLFDPPWRIGEFFGSIESIDVLSQQTSAAYTGEWNRQGGKWVRSCAGEPPEAWFRGAWDEEQSCWTGDVPGVSRSIQADRKYGKPVLNSENGYEFLPGLPTSNRQVHHTDKVRRTAWRIVCAGGYLAAGFQGTLGHSDAWERIDAPNRYPFSLEDAGAAGQLRILYDFFSTAPYWRMHPANEIDGNAVGLAEPGRIHIFYLPEGGEVRADLPGESKSWRARWLNPRNGESGADFAVPANGRFRAPDHADWVLRVESGGRNEP